MFLNRRGRKVTQRLMLFFSLCLGAFVVQAEENVTVAVASSYYEKAQQIKVQFEQDHDVKVRLVSGSTGRLFNQIKQGAPFDIWIAADNKRPALLKAKHKLIGRGYVGIATADGMIDLNALLQSNIQHIAIANPDVAPFGLAAKSMLQSQGLWEALKPKLVYAQNAMQASMMVKQGLTDAGFVPIMDKTHALAELPYVAVLLSKRKQAQMFYKALGSEAQGEWQSQRGHPGESASQGKLSYSATKVAPPSGSEALASPNYYKP